MFGLLRYLRHYKKESILAPAFKMLEAFFDLMVPLVVAAMIDNGIANDDIYYIIRSGVLLLVLAVVGMAFSISAQYFAAKAAGGFGTELRHELFLHIQSLSYDGIDNIGTSTLITRMTADVNQVQAQLNMSLRLLLRSPFIVVGAAVLSFMVDFKMSLIFVISILALSVIIFGIMLITIPLYGRAQSALDKVMGSTRQNLSGARVIRAFGQEDVEVSRYDEENGILNKFQIFAGRISTLMNPVTYIVINLAIVAILWFGGGRVNTGHLTQGGIVALVNYMSQVLVELVKLASLIINLTRAFACANRIQEVFHTKPEGEGGNIREGLGSDVEVEFDDVSLRYENAGEDTLNGVSVKVLKGQTVGIIGSTGAGKTSMINMIPGFYKATKGSVKIDGVDVKDYKKDVLLEKVGIVPQDAKLFSGTIRSNLLWGNKNATKKELEDALSMSQSLDFVMGKEGGLDARVEQNGKNFSGGQKQRLTIARALVKKPEILILDDASSALDAVTDANLWKAIAGLKEMTVFIVSQRMSSIKNADLILVLDDGAVVGAGTHESLIRDCNVYRQIVDSQTGESKGVAYE